MKKINLYGVVGWDFDSATVKMALDRIDGEDVEVEINSPGGAAYEGISIFNVLKQYDGKVTTVINGLAASAASIFFLAGDERKTLEGSFYMIHNSSNFFFGSYSKNEMRKSVAQLEKFDATAAKFYKKYTSIDDPTQKMDDDTFFTTDEMIESGIVSEVVEGSSNQQGGQENMFNNVKEAFMKTNSSLFNSEEDKPEDNQPEKKEGSEMPEELQNFVTEIKNTFESFSKVSEDMKEEVSNIKNDIETFKKEIKNEATETQNQIDEAAAEREAALQAKEDAAAEKEAAIEAKEKALKEKEEKLNNYFPSEPESDTQNKWGAF